MSPRDKTLDRLRGFAMLWVIVVHVLYWGNFFVNGYVNLLKSFCLFEMPLFFFITGASNSFSRVNSYFDFVSKRFRRILIPYWAFAIICALLSIAKYSVESSIGLMDAIIIVLSWLLPVDRQITSISYLTWALWFVPVYLCIVMLIPAFKRMKQSQQKIGFGILLAVLFVGTCWLNLGWIQYVAFYALWTYIGLFYGDIKSAIKQKYFRKYLLCVFVIGVSLICVLYFAGEPIDMQYNKFPPNIMFLIFSCVMMALLMQVLPYLKKLFEKIKKYKLISKIFDLYITRSMTIFLYQVFAFNLTIRISNMLFPGEGIIASAAKFVFCLLTTLPVCAALAVIFGKIENLRTKQNKENEKNEKSN